MSLSAQPLLDVARELGIEAETLADEERVDSLAGTFTVTSAGVQALTTASLDQLVDAYGDSVLLQIGTGVLPQLVVQNGTYSREEHGDLTSEAQSTPADYTVVLKIHKIKLLESFGGSEASMIRLFFFGRVFEQILIQDPAHIERELWHEAGQRLVVAVLDSRLRISGTCLSVVGGQHPQSLEALTEERGLSLPADLDRLADRRLHYVGWDSNVTTRLTPLHFLRPPTPDAGAIGARMDVLAVGLAAMYLCDRARGVEPEGGRPYVQAEFRGRDHVAFVPIDWTRSLPGVKDKHRMAMADVVAWCYETIPAHRSGDMVGDRLPFVQTRIAQLLEGRGEQERLLGLALTMPAVDEGVRSAWRSFIEGRVNEYLEQVRELEKAVGATVDRFAEQVGGLVKRLSETSLAAVAALIASIVAATFGDPFRVELFRVGMLAYAGYVIVFPLGLGLSSAVGDVRQADQSFAVQRGNLSDVLGEDRVEKIVGQRASKAKRRFYCWAWVVGVAYVVAAAAVAVAAFGVPLLAAAAGE